MLPVSVQQGGAQHGLIAPASIHWATWVHPAAHAELHTTKGNPSAVPGLKVTLDKPVEAAVATLECGHVWTTATLSQLLILNHFRDPPLTAGTKSESQIVSYGFKRAICMTTISNVCCGIEQILHFTKEIKITSPVLKVRKWSHRVMKLLSTSTKQARGSSSTKSQLCCKSTGQCPPLTPGQFTSPENTPIIFLEFSSICEDRCQAENKPNSVSLFKNMN